MEQGNQTHEEPVQDTDSPESIVLASTHSRMLSLQEIRNGNAGLNAHRQSMLDRVPEIGDWAAFRLNSLELIDLAYLSAKTGHEFAILRGKHKDILFHGSPRHCDFDEMLSEMLVNHRLILIAHSHPGEDQPMASDEDRTALKLFGQKRSYIISGLSGKSIEFSQDKFEMFNW